MIMGSPRDNRNGNPANMKRMKDQKGHEEQQMNELPSRRADLHAETQDLPLQFFITASWTFASFMLVGLTVPRSSQ